MLTIWCQCLFIWPCYEGTSKFGHNVPPPVQREHPYTLCKIGLTKFGCGRAIMPRLSHKLAIYSETSITMLILTLTSLTPKFNLTDNQNLNLNLNPNLNPNINLHKIVQLFMNFGFSRILLIAQALGTPASAQGRVLHYPNPTASLP